MDTTGISACERMVMKVIWDSEEELALQEVMDRVNEENGKKWKPQTVSTFLARLVHKNFLAVYRKGRYSYYQPIVSKTDFWKATMQETAQFFAQGDMAAMACQLCDELLTAEDRKKLQKKMESF